MALKRRDFGLEQGCVARVAFGTLAPWSRSGLIVVRQVCRIDDEKTSGEYASSNREGFGTESGCILLGVRRASPSFDAARRKASKTGG